MSILKHPFIVLEGLDGTGKTTVSGLVAERIGATRIATPMEPYASRRPRFDEDTWVPEVSFRFYLEAVVDASSKIEALCEDGPVVCDRYVASTYAYHTALGMTSGTAAAMIAAADILQPTIGIQLDAMDDVLERRLMQRSSRALDRQRLARIRSAYKGFQYEVLDTTYLTPDEVTDKILNLLRELGVIRP